MNAPLSLDYGTVIGRSPSLVVSEEASPGMAERWRPSGSQAWRTWAKGRRCREIEQAVASRHRGDGPEDRGDLGLMKHRLRFEVRAETMALFREAHAAVRSELGGAIDDDTPLHEIARRVLSGPDDEGRASYQVAVTQCEDCGRTAIDARGTGHQVDHAVAATTSCDAQHIRRVGGAHTSPHEGAPTPTREGAKQTPGAASPHGGAGSSKRARATKTIPPAMRREVLRRDRRRCVVPGCRSHIFLDVHHLDPRAEGGGHHPDRLTTPCGGHHRSVHLGHLCIQGTASEGFSFRHGDGTRYGQAWSPRRLDLASLALDALQHMGSKRPRREGSSMQCSPWTPCPRIRRLRSRGIASDVVKRRLPSWLWDRLQHAATERQGPA